MGKTWPLARERTGAATLQGKVLLALTEDGLSTEVNAGENVDERCTTRQLCVSCGSWQVGKSNFDALLM